MRPIGLATAALLAVAFQISLAEGADWARWANPTQAGWDEAGLRAAVDLAEGSGTAALFVAHDGRALLSWGEVERKLSAHSIRKQLMSGLIGIQAETGTIDLDATLDDLEIDDLSALTPQEKRASVLDLLSGRSGVYHPAAYETPGKKRERPARGSHAPGTHFWSNNWDFNTLLTIFEQQTGTRFFEELDRAIATPLGMQDFEPADGEYHAEPTVSKHPAYPLRISARDLARYGQLILDDGEWNDARIIPTDWIDLSTSAHTTFGEGGGYTGNFRPGAGFGLMWWLYPAGCQPEGRPELNSLDIVAAQGSGGHLMLVIRELDLVIVHRAPTDDGERVAWDDAWAIAERVVAARASQPSVASADPFEYAFEEVSPGVWVGTRENSPRFPVMGTTTFVVGGEGVVVFDGGGSALMSERALAKIRSVTDKPVTHIVISHWHGDHNLGIHRFLDEFPHAQVIGHAFTRAAMLGAPMDYVRDYQNVVPRLEKRFRERLDSGVDGKGEPISDSMRGNLQEILEHTELIHSEYLRARVTPPAVTFSDRLEIRSGDRVIQLLHLGHGNTAGDIVMWLPQERIVAAGDLVVVPIPYGFNVPPRAWVATLRELKALNFTTLIPGHGDLQNDSSYVDLLIEAAESIADQRDALLAEGKTPEETEAALDFSALEERFTGGDEFLSNRFEVWFSGPFGKAALKALTGEPMVSLEQE